jgi:hypothetical protein
VEGLTFPKGLDEAIAKAMAKDRGSRYQSAIEYAAALRPFAGATVTSLDNIFQMTPAPPSVGPASSQGSSALAATSNSGRPGVGVLLGVAAICLLVGALITVLLLKFVVP